MGRTSKVVVISACLLAAGSMVSGRQQGELSGIRGLPVQGHDVIAGVEIVGKEVPRTLLSGARERFRSNGAELRLGFPLESQTVCRFKEVLRDVMTEKGYPDATIALDTRPTYGDRRELTLAFTVTEGKRSRRAMSAAELKTPAERCAR